MINQNNKLQKYKPFTFTLIFISMPNIKMTNYKKTFFLTDYFNFAMNHFVTKAHKSKRKFSNFGSRGLQIVTCNPQAPWDMILC